MEDMVTEKFFDSKFTDLKEYLEEKFNTNEVSHKGIMDRQDHTNGNVTTNTKDINNLKTWRYGLLIGGTVAWLLSGTIFYLFMQNLQYSIKDSISVVVKEHDLETEKKITSLQSDMRSIAKDEVDNFAKKNFNSYQK